MIGGRPSSSSVGIWLSIRAQHHADLVALVEAAHAEASDVGHADREVALVRLLELLALLRIHHAQHQVTRLLRRERLLGDRRDLAVDLDRRRHAGRVDRSEARCCAISLRYDEKSIEPGLVAAAGEGAAGDVLIGGSPRDSHWVASATGHRIEVRRGARWPAPRGARPQAGGYVIRTGACRGRIPRACVFRIVRA